MMKHMKHMAIVSALTVGLLFGGAAGSGAEHRKKHVTPYGDFCSTVSHYGIHHGNLTNRQIAKSLKHYFGKKGLSFEVINFRGRFVKAKIMDGNSVVDTIIFDRKSGRIRSIN